MPESALPYAIHLLAYGPLYPTRLGSDVDFTAAFKPMQLQLAQLLDALLHEDATRPANQPGLNTLAHMLHLLQVGVGGFVYEVGGFVYEVGGFVYGV